MTVGLLLAAAGFLTLPLWTRRLGRRLNPSTWARLCLAAMIVGGATVELAAVLFALPTVLRAAGVPELARACERMLAPLTPGGAWAGWTAAAAALTIPALAMVGLRRARATYVGVRAEPALGEHHPFAGHDCVVLPTAEPLAVSVAGEPGQIIVSQGLVDHLAPAELAAVLRHEAAHLDHGHADYLLAATALDHAFAFLPFVRRSTAALRLALERWADEVAAGPDPARRSELVDALLAVGHLLVGGTELAAFSSADSMAERVEALQRGPSSVSFAQRAALLVPGTTLGVTLVVALGAWVRDAHIVLAMAGRCPS